MPENTAPSLPQQQPLDEDRLKQWLNSQTISAQKLRTGAVQTGNTVESSNFVSGSDGWQIDGDGNAEFNDVTVRGVFKTAESGARLELQEFGSATYFNIYNATELRMSVGLNSSLATSDSARLAAFNGADAIIYSVSGDVWLWADSGDVRLRANNTTGLSVLATSTVNSPFIRDLTTGSGANVFIGATSGNMARSTSSLKYKPDWRPAPEAVDYELPLPIKWTDEKGQLRLAFGAEHVWDSIPEAFEEENYDLRSIVAILSEKVKRLERTSPARRLARWLGQPLRSVLHLRDRCRVTQ